MRARTMAVCTRGACARWRMRLSVAALAAVWCVRAAAPAVAQDAGTPPVLAAFSLRAGLAADSAAARQVTYAGFITRVWAVVFDPERNDVIVVGERDPRLPPLLLEDVLDAVGTADKMGGADNPGVSVMPPADDYSATQRVVWFGGISGHYARGAPE